MSGWCDCLMHVGLGTLLEECDWAVVSKRWGRECPYTLLNR